MGIVKLDLSGKGIVKRKINGKLYKSAFSASTKAEAKRTAKTLRKHGVLARVIETPESIKKRLDIRKEYLVLVRSPTKYDFRMK